MGLFNWIKNIGKSVKNEMDELVEEGKIIENDDTASSFMEEKKIPKWEPLFLKEEVKESIKIEPKKEIIKEPKIYINEDIKEKYNLIVRQIKLRQEEVNNLDKNDPKLISLVNELNAYKRKADKLKKDMFIK